MEKVPKIRMALGLAQLYFARMFFEQGNFKNFNEKFPKTQAEFITKFALNREHVGQKVVTAERIFGSSRLQNLVKFSPVTTFSKLDLVSKPNDCEKFCGDEFRQRRPF